METKSLTTNSLLEFQLRYNLLVGFKKKIKKRLNKEIKRILSFSAYKGDKRI